MPGHGHCVTAMLLRKCSTLPGQPTDFCAADNPTTQNGGADVVEALHEAGHPMKKLPGTYQFWRCVKFFIRLGWAPGFGEVTLAMMQSREVEDPSPAKLGLWNDAS